MKLQVCLLSFIFALFGVCVSAHASSVINYSGQVNVDGEAYTGTGYFKMAFVSETGATVWSNDGTSVNGSEPSSDFDTQISDGSFTAFLGDESLMNTFDNSIFNTDDELYLRIWFDDGRNGFTVLSPDIRITSGIYAVQSETLQGYVPDDFLKVSDAGSVSTSILADSAVTTTKASFFSDSGKTIKVGDASDGTVKIEANIGGAANPSIRYNVSTDQWELSNNGATFTAISTGASLGATDLGDITSVLAGSGLSGGSLSGGATLSLNQAFTPTWTGAQTFMTDVNLTFAGTENLALTSDLAGTMDVLSLIGTPSATAGVARGLVIQQADSANTNGLDTAFLIDNADADLALTTGLQITGSSTGLVTTALDVSDVEIGIAVALGLNDVTVGGVTLSSTELSYLDGTTSNIQTQIDALVGAGGDITAVTAGAGLTGGAAAGAATVDVGAGSGIAVAADAIGFDYTSTLAGNPALTAGQAMFDSGDSQGGILFEGAVANGFESLLTVAEPTGDQTWTLPDTTGTVALTSSNVATATALAADPADCGANTFATTINASGTLTCASVADSYITADTLDFTELEDTLDLDANLIVNQAGFTWVQNYTGVDGGAANSAYTFNANTLTDDIAVTINAPSLEVNGIGLAVLGAGAGGITGRLMGLSSYLGNDAINLYSVANLNADNPATPAINISLNTINQYAAGASVGTGIYNVFTDAQAQANTNYGYLGNISNTGANAAGSKSVWGAIHDVTATGAIGGTTGGIGQQIVVNATHAVDAGDVYNYGIYIQDGTSNTNGNSYKYGIYVDPMTNADLNVGAYFGSAVGIGDTTPDTELDVAGDIWAEQICDETGANCQDISAGWTSGDITAVTAGAGLTGGAASGAATVDVGAGSGIAVAADAIGFDYTSTLAGNPALTAGQAMFDSGDSQGGILFEGAVANGFESLLTVAEPTGDQTWTLPDTTGTVALTSSNVATATALAADPADCGANTFATTINASGTLTCASVADSYITADTLDFTEFEDTLDLDAALIVNQGVSTWTQNFTDTSGVAFTYNATSLAAGGVALDVNGPAAGGNTGVLVDLSSYLGDAGILLQSVANLNAVNASPAANFYLTTTNQYNGGNSSARGVVNQLTDGQAQANQNIGYWGIVTNTGANAAGGKQIYGALQQVSSTGSTNGTTTAYGEHLSVTATHAADAGTINNFGLYVADGTSSTNGASTKYGIYVEPMTLADENYGAYIGSNVGIGDTTPDTELDVTGDIWAEQICDETGANCQDISGGWADITGVTAGAGLTGGAASGAATVDIGAGTGITANADDIAVNQDTAFAWTNSHTYTFAADEEVYIDAVTTAHTATNGVLDMNVAAGDAAVVVQDIAFTQNDGVTAGRDAIAHNILLNGNDADGDMFGIKIRAADSGNAAAGTYEAAITIDNEEQTPATMTDAILITSSGVNNGVTDAIDVSAANIANAINIGGNPIATGNVAGTIGDASTDSWTFTTDGTGTGEIVLPLNSVAGAEIVADDLDFTELQDTLDLDAALIVNQGTNSWTQNYAHTSGIASTINLESASEEAAAMRIKGPSGGSAGLKNMLFEIVSDLGDPAGDGAYGVYLNFIPDSGGQVIGQHIWMPNTYSGAVSTLYGYSAFIHDSSTAANSNYGASINATNDGNVTGTANVYGGYFTADVSGASSGTKNVHGLYASTSSSTTDGAGTINDYGVYINNGGGDVTGTTTKYGLYVEAMAGADNNYSAFFGGTVMIAAPPNNGNNAALCWDNAGNSLIEDCNGAPADLAENFGTDDDTIEAGDIVITDGRAEGVTVNDSYSIKAFIQKSTEAYEEAAIGVVSTQPNQVYGDDGLFTDEENPQPVSLAGRVPVKVNLENGPIHAGDAITTSSEPGVGMRATGSGRIVGIALEDFDETDDDGKIAMMVNPSWYSPANAYVELVDTIDAQENHVQALEAEVSGLKTRLQSLEERLDAIEAR